MIQTHKLLSFAGLSFILLFTSCTMEKRVYMPGYYVDWYKQKHKLNKQMEVVNKNAKITELNKITSFELTDNNINSPNSNNIVNNENLLASVDNSVIPVINPSTKNSKKENSHTKLNPKNTPGDCDIIVLLTGEKINAKVIEIGEERIKYKLCDNQDGPIISINKSEVALITHPDGTEDIINANDSNTLYQNYLNKKTPGLTTIGFIASIISFFVFGIVLGTLAIIFGCVSLAKIKREPKKYKGRGLAIASIVLGIISIIAVLILLSLTL